MRDWKPMMRCVLLLGRRSWRDGLLLRNTKGHRKVFGVALHLLECLCWGSEQIGPRRTAWSSHMTSPHVLRHIIHIRGGG